MQTNCPIHDRDSQLLEQLFARFTRINLSVLRTHTPRLTIADHAVHTGVEIVRDASLLEMLQEFRATSSIALGEVGLVAFESLAIGLALGHVGLDAVIGLLAVS